MKAKVSCIWCVGQWPCLEKGLRGIWAAFINLLATWVLKACPIKKQTKNWWWGSRQYLFGLGNKGLKTIAGWSRKITFTFSISAEVFYFLSDTPSRRGVALSQNQNSMVYLSVFYLQCAYQKKYSMILRIAKMLKCGKWTSEMQPVGETGTLFATGCSASQSH